MADGVCQLGEQTAGGANTGTPVVEALVFRERGLGWRQEGPYDGSGGLFMPSIMTTIGVE